MTQISELTLTPQEASWVTQARDRFGSVDAVEQTLCCGSELHEASLAVSDLRQRIQQQWRLNDYVVLRQVPQCAQGTTGILLAALCVKRFVFYEGHRLARHFRMSPWTKSLSHTLAAGTFHTDFNTADAPPGTTAIQCLDADPGAPDYGQLRVARFQDVLDRLAGIAPDTARFLAREEVTMLSASSPLGWRGKIFANGLVRFHPEGLLAAQRLLGRNPPDLEIHLAHVSAAAQHLSLPLHLGPGDMLLVSNRRALHQRGACTVRFMEFPMRFEARRVSVFHAEDEPA